MDGAPDSFSRRHGFRPQEAEITVREDAPDDLRFSLLAIAHDEFDLSPSALRRAVCRVLRRRPDPGNWSEYPNIWGEVQDLVYSCQWWRVYDIIEALYLLIAGGRAAGAAERYAEAINGCFAELGIGWKLEDGVVVTRGEETAEAVLAEAEAQLGESGLPTAQSELREARRDLSRRPDPDVSGAVQHAMAALVPCQSTSDG